MYEEEINEHLDKIREIKSQIDKLIANSEKTANAFLSADINKKILDYEVMQLDNEVTLHYFCIDCIKHYRYLDLTLDSKFTNAKKKKLSKLATKNKFSL